MFYEQALLTFHPFLFFNSVLTGLLYDLVKYGITLKFDFYNVKKGISDLIIRICNSYINNLHFKFIPMSQYCRLVKPYTFHTLSLSSSIQVWFYLTLSCFIASLNFAIILCPIAQFLGKNHFIFITSFSSYYTLSRFNTYKRHRYTICCFGSFPCYSTIDNKFYF